MDESYEEDSQSSDDTSLYVKNIRELMLEDDEISPFEECFMEGYDSAC